MLRIRIAPKNWGEVWRALVAAGPVARVSDEPIYVVSEEQVRLLRRKNLPFEVVDLPNGQTGERRHG